MHKDKLRIGYNRDLSIKYDQIFKKNDGKTTDSEPKKEGEKKE